MLTIPLRRVVSGLVSLSLALSGWPMGWLGARNPLATQKAKAASDDVILLWDGGDIRVTTQDGPRAICLTSQARQEGSRKVWMDWMKARKGGSLESTFKPKRPSTALWGGRS